MWVKMPLAGLLRLVLGVSRRVAIALSRLPVLRQLRGVQFRRMKPLAGGAARGTPIVRYYWARFLDAHRGDIRGHALEVGTTDTVRRYGGDAIDVADAIDLAAHDTQVTVVADLSRAHEVPPDTYDCFLNQFTMHVIADVESALYHSVRILRPGGILLVNFPCLDYYFPFGLDMGTGGRQFVHWWFTQIGVENLLRRVGLTESDYRLQVYGNLFARVAYQLNLSAEELTHSELDHVDEGYPLLVCVRVVKPASWSTEPPPEKAFWLPDVAPARWDPVTGHVPR